LFGLSLTAACLSVLQPSGALAAERTVDLELVLAADISGSMDEDEAALQRLGYIHALRHPEVIDAITSGPLGRIAVTYVEWAGDHYQDVLVDWRVISDEAGAAAFARALEAPAVKIEQWTSISTIIAFATRSFDNNGYRGQRRIIDISGDGPNNRGIYVVDARDRALASGVTINGLPILNDRVGRYLYPPMPDLDLYYEDCVIGGEGAFIVVANGFADFARAVRRKLVLEIAGHTPPDRLLRLVSNRPRPPCDAGESQLRKWMDSISSEFDDYH
jgi:hypothetical protein